VRGEIDLRREYLKRHGDEVVAQDDNVAVVKTARSA
jgi:urease accessory protein UreE